MYSRRSDGSFSVQVTGWLWPEARIDEHARKQSYGVAARFTHNH